MSQLPQWSWSIRTLVHTAVVPGHIIAPRAHAHVPPMHAPAPHCVPQPPQSFASVFVSTHAVPHVVRGAVHASWHAPPKQNWPVPHAWPHMPQFIGSLSVVTHAPPHDVVPRGHAQPVTVQT